MLQVKNLTFTYPGKKIPTIADLSMKIESGGVYGLLGKNGAGKSTLLYLLSGLLTPQSGYVEFDGLNTRKRLPSTLADIFIVPEEFDLPAVNLSEYVKIFSRFYPRFSDEDMHRHLTTFDLDGNPNLGALSMGEKKKVFMSVAMACNSPLLLMDEPTNGLDIPGKAAFRRFIASSMTDERSTVISTHQVRDIDRVIDHVMLLHQSDMIVNTPLDLIAQRLIFTETDDADILSSALYTQTGIRGASVVLRREQFPDMETEPNIETLFELAIERPEIIIEIFKEKGGEL